MGSLAQGGATLSTEEALFDVLSDQTGDLVKNQIFRGGSKSIEMPLIEMTDENWIALVGNGAGSTYTNGSESYVGYGTDKLYKSSFEFAGILVGHPIRLPETDRSKDIVMWKTMPIMSDINFSGSDIQTANLSFTGLIDRSKPEQINVLARGDYSKL